jgi:two-component system, NarL family, response regulator
VTEKAIRILLVDDHPMIRAGLAATIKPEPDMTVVATAANGKEALEQYRIHRPDVTLMDLKMPEMGGVDALRAIRAEFSAAKIIVLTTYQGEEDIYRAMQAGAVTYLLKDTLPENMMRMIREVACGGRPMPPGVAQKFTDRVFQPTLTPRELEVLGLVARGLRNKEVAADLRISEDTIQGHLKSIFAKLSVRDRTAAVAVAIQRGIVHLD